MRVNFISPEAALYNIRIHENTGSTSARMVFTKDGAQEDLDGVRNGVFSYDVSLQTTFSFMPKTAGAALAEYIIREDAGSSYGISVEKNQYRSSSSLKDQYELREGQIDLKFSSDEGLGDFISRINKDAYYGPNGREDIGTEQLSWETIERITGSKPFNGNQDLYDNLVGLFARHKVDLDMDEALPYMRNNYSFMLEGLSSTDDTIKRQEYKYIFNRDLSQQILDNLLVRGRVEAEWVSAHLKRYLQSFRSEFSLAALERMKTLVDLWMTRTFEANSSQPEGATRASLTAVADNVKKNRLIARSGDRSLGPQTNAEGDQWWFWQDREEIERSLSEASYTSLYIWQRLAYLLTGTIADPADRTGIVQTTSDNIVEIVNNSVVWLSGARRASNMQEAGELLERFMRVDLLDPPWFSNAFGQYGAALRDNVNSFLRQDPAVLARYAVNNPEILQFAQSLYHRLATAREANTLSVQVRDAILKEKLVKPAFTQFIDSLNSMKNWKSTQITARAEAILAFIKKVEEDAPVKIAYKPALWDKAKIESLLKVFVRVSAKNGFSDVKQKFNMTPEDHRDIDAIAHLIADDIGYNTILNELGGAAGSFAALTAFISISLSTDVYARQAAVTPSIRAASLMGDLRGLMDLGKHIDAPFFGSKFADAIKIAGKVEKAQGAAGIQQAAELRALASVFKEAGDRRAEAAVRKASDDLFEAAYRAGVAAALQERLINSEAASLSSKMMATVKESVNFHADGRFAGMRSSLARMFGNAGSIVQNWLLGGVAGKSAMFGTIAGGIGLSAAIVGGPVIGAVFFGGSLISGALAVVAFAKRSHRDV